jgi:toxin ParE1/3/4
MAQLIWTESALSNLNDIAEYIALENPLVAKALARRMFSSVERLQEHPSSEKFPAELESKRSERQLRNLLIDEAENRGS